MATLNEILGTLPDGTVKLLDDDGLTKFLRDKYRTDAEEKRKREARMRLDLYQDKGRVHFEKAIDDVFTNHKVREWRKKFVQFAEFQNVTRRVVREISSVYSESAKRKVKDPADNLVYQLFQRETRQDRVMRKVNQLGNLLNHILVWPDVVNADDGKRAILRTVTTDKLRAIAHPNDKLRAVGFIIDQFPAGVRAMPTDRHYLILSEEEYLWLDKDWRLAGRKPHGLGRMPALLWSREEPEDSILDGTSGRDITSAHLAVALLNTMMLKHQKSGTKMPIVTGDTSGMARGQPMDEESILEAPEGTFFQTLDLGADPSSYIDSVRAVIKQIAANYGIPESVFDLSYQSTSGFEIELKRSGLREIRRDQILNFRPFERDLVELWSVVLNNSSHPFAFDIEGWSIDFGEIDVPTEPMSKLDYWLKLEDMDLFNRVQMYMSQNPEATEDDALEAIARNQELKIGRMQELQRANGASNGGGLFSAENQAAADQPPGEAAPNDLDTIAKQVLGL